MTRLEDIRVGTAVRGVVPGGLAKIVGVEWYGDRAIKVVYEDGEGTPSSRLVYRDEESSLELVSSEAPWSFDGDGAILRLVSEELPCPGPPSYPSSPDVVEKLSKKSGQPQNGDLRSSRNGANGAHFAVVYPRFLRSRHRRATF